MRPRVDRVVGEVGQGRGGATGPLIETAAPGRPSLVMAGGWGLLAMVAGLVVLPLEPNLLEEGQMLHVAQRMAAGDHLYRDIVYYTGPAPFELLALIFRIFGDSLVAGRLAIVLMLGLATGCSYAVATRADVGSLAHVAAALWAVAPILLFPLPITYFYTTVAFYLIPIAIHAALRGTVSARYAFLAGALVAAIALCKQVFGVVLLLSLVPAFAFATDGLTRVRRLLALLAGGAAVTLATLAAYWIRGDLSVFVYSLVTLPLELKATFHAPFINLWPIGELSPELLPFGPLYMPSLMFVHGSIVAEPDPVAVALTQLLYALPFIALGATLASSLRGRLRPAVWIHAAGLITLTSNLYPRSDWGHLLYVLPAALVQLVLVAGSTRQEAADPMRRERPAARVTALALCFVLYTAATATGTWLNTISWPQSLGPAVPLRPVTRSLRGAVVPRVINYLQSHVYPGEEIFVARQEPLIYFATGTRNPTPYTGVVMGIQERQQREILEGLERVRYVVMSDIDQPLYAYYSEELPEVQRYLERHFRVPLDFPIDSYSWIQVLERGPDRGRAIVDFASQREEGRFWRRDGQGRIHRVEDDVPKLPSRQVRRPFAVRLGEAGGGVDFDVDVPPGAVLQTDLGLLTIVSQADRHDHSGAARHAISVSRDGSSFERLVTGRLSDLHPRLAVRWRPMWADLSEYAGERVVLRLEIIADAPIFVGDLGWFGSPRLAVPGAGT